MDLATLLERCRQGDDLAWEAFVRQFQSRVYALALHYAREADEARDFAQEVFVHLYETRRKWAPADEFLPWLIRVTRNTCIDQLRRKRARPPAFGVPVDGGVALRDGGRSPEELSVASDRRRLVHEALGMLGAISREMIVLKDIHGLSLEQIAAMLHVPLGTVKSRSNRARSELGRRLVELMRGRRGATVDESA